MANIKSQIKRNRQTEKRNGRNRAVRSELRTRVKTALATEGDDTEELRIAIKALDKAAQKGILHKNTVARKKSRLIKAVRSTDDAS